MQLSAEVVCPMNTMRNFLQRHLIVIVAMLQLIGAEDFCDSSLCKRGVTHVACNRVTGMQATCPANNAREVRITGAMQQKIVDMHNQHRSRLASGKLPNYKPASQMLQMV